MNTIDIGIRSVHMHRGKLRILTIRQIWSLKLDISIWGWQVYLRYVYPKCVIMNHYEGKNYVLTCILECGFVWIFLRTCKRNEKEKEKGQTGGNCTPKSQSNRSPDRARRGPNWTAFEAVMTLIQVSYFYEIRNIAPTDSGVMPGKKTSRQRGEEEVLKIHDWSTFGLRLTVLKKSLCKNYSNGENCMKRETGIWLNIWERTSQLGTKIPGGGLWGLSAWGKTLKIVGHVSKVPPTSESYFFRVFSLRAILMEMLHRLNCLCLAGFFEVVCIDYNCVFWRVF